MLVTTTPNIEGKNITKYIGLVNGEAIIGANFVKDILAGIRTSLEDGRVHMSKGSGKRKASPLRK